MPDLHILSCLSHLWLLTSPQALRPSSFFRPSSDLKTSHVSDGSFTPSLTPGGDATEDEAPIFCAAQWSSGVTLTGVHDALLGDPRGAKHGASDDVSGLGVVPGGEKR